MNEDIIEEENEKREVVNQYQKGQTLGSGGFAKCYEVLHLGSSKKYAIKIVSKEEISDEKSKQKLLLQIKIHKSLSHKNVVRFDHVFEDRENVYILMELCRNQTLKELQKRRSRLTEFELRVYLQQIVSGVGYLHDNLIIHRDLKLGNIFINHKMELKLGDFGLSTKLRSREETRKTVCGTPNYIAPEILFEKGHSFESDLFSLGVILYTLMFGKPPYQADTVEDTYSNIKANNYQFPKHSTASAQVKDLISNLLLLEPSKRLTLDQIRSHPFLNPTYQIPQFLPCATLTVPPLASYIKQFLPQGFAIKLTEKPRRLLKAKPEERRLEKCKSVEGHLNDPPLQFQPEPSNNPNNNALIIKFDQQKKKQQILKRIRSLGSLKSARPCQQELTEVVEVNKFSDCSDKYGYGYTLSTGSVGVLFNDKSTILEDSGRKLWYGAYSAPLEAIDRQNPQASKKLQILQLIKNHFNSKYKQEPLTRDRIKTSFYESVTEKKMSLKSKGETKGEPVHVQKVVLEGNYYVFKLSNKTLLFRWQQDFVVFRDYKWVKYRVKGLEGEGLVGAQFEPKVECRMTKVRYFLRQRTSAKI